MDNLPEKKITCYDKQRFFTESIEPLLIEIKRLCVLNQIPCFFSFATKNTEKATTYKNDGIFTGSYEINLKSDMFPDMFSVINGIKYDVEKKRLVLPDVGLSDRDITNYIMDQKEDLQSDELVMTEEEKNRFLETRTPKKRSTKKEMEEKRTSLQKKAKIKSEQK